MQNLSNAQLKYLRKESHSHKPIFQMGKNGLSEAFIEQVDQALERRELIKFTVLQNSDESVDDVAHQIAEAVEASVVQVIGSTAILYRPSSKDKFKRISPEVAKI